MTRGLTRALRASTIFVVAVWYSIEVFDGGASASLWAEAHGDALVEAALTTGVASDWTWHRHSWGVVFEVQVPDEDAWQRFCAHPTVTRALDAVPDPLTGLIVYKGRGGSAGESYPRRPRPLAGSGAAALPLPFELGTDDVASIWALVQPAPLASAVNRL